MQNGAGQLFDGAMGGVEIGNSLVAQERLGSRTSDTQFCRLAYLLPGRRSLRIWCRRSGRMVSPNSLLRQGCSCPAGASCRSPPG